MLRHNLIEERDIWKGKSRIVFWDPTPKAFELLGIDQPDNKPNPGYLHRAGSKHIEIYAKENGFKVFPEWRLANDRYVDLMIQKNSQGMVFIEVGMSSAQNELENAVNDLSTDVIPDRLIMACKDTKMKKQLERLIQSDSRLDTYRKRIEVVLAGKFIQTSK